MLLSLFPSVILALAPHAPAAPTADQAIAPQPPAASAAAGEIWFSFPGEGTVLTPVLLVGMDFANQGLLPYFGLIPSIPLFQFGVDIPFLGQVAIMVTTVPILVLPGDTELFLKRGFFGQESNHLPFTVLS